MKARNLGLGLVAAVTALLAGAAHAGGTSGSQAIATFRVMASGTVVVEGATDKWDNPDGCEDSQYIVLSESSDHFEEKYAALLAARLSESPVSAWLEGCEAYVGVTYPRIKSLKF